ncbi:hypothetical protein RCOM_1621120 [Ricinus communis]|uniref:C2H2-type domain-containing protein n=1 Tax=Ricinus communis TaxID=3988 RepID=B9REG7_RICCO|nr:hypothetical protein RCOM_1621120 [Ricinus communis]|eukprot:XP_002512106.1 uncharacterized protein LOC8289133 [Ricinus communis]
MEPNAKKKLFICKFCNKRYPCGKSLGGHIRIHLNGNGNGYGNSTDIEEEDMKLNTSKSFAAANVSNSKQELELEAGARSGYGLRENPKKTKRFMADSSKGNLLQEKVCKECGKGFQSLKALCGHMACHSKNSFEDQSETTEKLKDQVFDSQSDTETSSAPSKRRRSKRMRYKAIGVYSSSLSLVNGSLSSASDVEQEQEEVAKCLMMLSKDSGFKGCFSSVADSSDNSVVLETKSSSPKLRISVKNGVSCVYNGNGILEIKKAKQHEVMSVGNEYSENSDSGYFKNGPKKVESDISVHGFTGIDEFKKQKIEFGSRFEDGFSPELGKRLSRVRRIKTELGKDLIEEDGYGETDGASFKYDSRKRDKRNDPELLSNIASKTCIGVQRTRHRRTNGCSESVYGSGENSIETDCAPSPLPSHNKKSQSCNGKTAIEQKLSGSVEKKLSLRKGKIHECPFCFKVFRSGQALGGHKRSHFVGGAQDRTLVINQQVSEISMPALIDLNLPAPVEEDANGYYIPSW